MTPIGAIGRKRTADERRAEHELEVLADQEHHAVHDRNTLSRRRWPC